MVSPWNGDGCDLRVGAVIQGHVSELEHKSKTNHHSAFALVIDSAECNHQKPVPFAATLIALLGPDNAPTGMGRDRTLTDQPALTNSAPTAAPSVAPSPTSGFRSVEASAAMNQYEPVGRTLPSQWKIGMVVDYPMNLAVGKGAEGGSIISSDTTDTRLEGNTTLFLLASPPAASPATSTAGAH